MKIKTNPLAIVGTALAVGALKGLKGTLQGATKALDPRIIKIDNSKSTYTNSTRKKRVDNQKKHRELDLTGVVATGVVGVAAVGAAAFLGANLAALAPFAALTSALHLGGYAATFVSGAALRTFCSAVWGGIRGGTAGFFQGGALGALLSANIRD